MATLQKHGWIGALCNIRVADWTRVVFGQTTHTLMFAALGHTHVTFAAVGVVFASPHSTNATLIAVVDVPASHTMHHCQLQHTQCTTVSGIQCSMHTACSALCEPLEGPGMVGDGHCVSLQGVRMDRSRPEAIPSDFPQVLQHLLGMVGAVTQYRQRGRSRLRSLGRSLCLRDDMRDDTPGTNLFRLIQPEPGLPAR